MRSSSRSGPISGLLRLPEEAATAGIGRLASVRWSLLLVALTLSVVGAATVHSASAEMPVEYLPRQLAWVGAGLLVFLVTFSLDYQRLALLALPFYGVAMALLVLVLFFGQVRGGSRSWFAVGPFGIQPSEVAKVATAILLAQYLAGLEGEYLRLREILTAGAIVLLPVVLLYFEPDLGGALMYLPLLASMLLVAGIKKRYLVVAACTAVVVAALGWGLIHDYQRERVLTFLNPQRDPLGAGYQVRQSKIAVGSGELVGRGYMQGTQSQLRFLPARHTDFIFAVLAEEWGFLGVAFVLFLYGSFLFGCAEVAARARDKLGMLLAVGFFATFAFHILWNTGMVVGLAPNSGIPLPFLSYGGSFMLFAFAATGLVLGVDFRRYVNR
jgi:rod shape determining protein RodA